MERELPIGVGWYDVYQIACALPCCTVENALNNHRLQYFGVYSASKVVEKASSASPTVVAISAPVLAVPSRARPQMFLSLPRGEVKLQLQHAA